MRLLRTNRRSDKGWYIGPWNGTFAFPVGYASAGIDEPHIHLRVTEVYLVARGTAEARVEHETILLKAGDMLIVEPGEAHTFVSSSPRYFHFVLHTPGLTEEEAHADKQTITRERLGLSS